MSKLTEAKNAVIAFLKEHVKSRETTIIKLEKSGDRWEITAEVYEDDSFLKSMNLPPKKTRVFYEIRLDSELEVTGYKRMGDNDS